MRVSPFYGEDSYFLALKLSIIVWTKILKTDPIFLRTYQSFPGLMFTLSFVALKVFLSVDTKKSGWYSNCKAKNKGLRVSTNVTDIQNQHLAMKFEALVVQKAISKLEYYLSEASSIKLYWGVSQSLIE